MALAGGALNSIVRPRDMRQLLAWPWLLVSSITTAADARATFTPPSGVAIQIVEAPFIAKDHRVVGCGESDTACLIDDRVPFGSAGLVPETYVKRISATYAGRTYELDASQMFNAWGGRHLSYKDSVRYFGGQCDATGSCAFRGLFSDAGGAFVAEWIVAHGKSLRTVITDSQDVIGLFMKNIDPPTFE